MIEWLSECCGAPPHEATPDVGSDNPAGICGQCRDHAGFEFAHDWREHRHEDGDTLDSQHGPNSHTHGADGRVDTIMGETHSIIFQRQNGGETR